MSAKLREFQRPSGKPETDGVRNIPRKSMPIGVLVLAPKVALKAGARFGALDILEDPSQPGSPRPWEATLRRRHPECRRGLPRGSPML